MKNKNTNIFKNNNSFFLTGKIFIACLFAVSAVLGGYFNNIKDIILPTKVLAATCTEPADIMLILDSSGSMDTNNKMTTTKTAAKNFIDNLNLSTALPSGDQVGFVTFNNLAELKNELTQDGNIVKNSIDNLIAGGQTNLKSAIEVGTIELNYIRHNASAKKVMVVLTDGMPNRPYPEDLAGMVALDAANEAKNIYGIRIITIGLDLQSLPEAERVAVTAVLANAASAPADFYQATDPASLSAIYDSISAALCDSTAPQIISYNRNPSGTVYSADTVKIVSTASDNIGIKSHLIKWTTDNWATENSSSSADCDTNRNNCSVIIGPFTSNTNIKYKIEVIDTNDNTTNSAVESFSVASLSLTASNFLRNTGNNINIAVNDPDGKLIAGGAKFYLSIESPDGGGVNKIDKMEMACVGDNINKSCSYVVNPGCDWIDSSAKIYIYPYDNNYDIKYHNPPETKSVTISSPIEAKTEPGRCTNCINDDCDAGNKWDLANYNNTSAGCGSTAIYDSNYAETACDGLAPIVAISRVPAGVILETDTLTLTSVATEIPSGLNALQRHKLWYRVNGGAWVNAIDCADIIFDGLCDADTSKNISNFSFTFPAYASGTVIDYYSEATDTTPGTPNTGRSSPGFDTIIVGYSECYNFDGTQKPALTACTGGKCCGGVCNSASTYNTNCTLDDECRQETCSGTAWTCAPANSGNNCSTLGGSTDGCFNYLTGCEERNYSCQADGSCNYPAPSNRNIDGCANPPNSNLFAEFSCSGNSCVATSPVDCSVPAGPGVCSCSCGGYGKEEKFYSAFSADGIDDYINVPNNVYSNNMTLEMWINPRVINSGSYQGFAGYQGASNFYRPFNLWIGPTNNALHWRISKSNNAETHGGMINNFFTSADIWYHIVFVKDGVKLKIYKNGVLNSLPDASFTDIYKPGVFWIGKIDNYFNGIIDETRIYNRALDETEVIQHYQGNYLNETNLVGLWHLDGNTNDSSGNVPLKNGILNLGSAGNTDVAAAWVSDKTNIGNISPVWRVCSDVDSLAVAIDNDCDGRSNSTPGSAETACDNNPPAIYLRTLPSTVYDDMTFTFASTASDEFGISQHRIWWTHDGWATSEEKICPALADCNIATTEIFPAGTFIEYRSEAVDNNGNYSFDDGFLTVLSRSCEFKPDGASCGSPICIDTLSLGCETRNYMCVTGLCEVPFPEIKDDTCGDWLASSKILSDFSCAADETCVFTTSDCSTAGAINGCACSCEGFGKEEKFYKALSLDGVDDSLNIPHSSALNMGIGEFAVEFWIKSTKNAAWEAIGKNSAWFGVGSGWHFSTAYSPADLLFEVSNGTSREYIPSGLGRAFDWKHIVGQRRINTIELYVDGEKVGEDYMPGNIDNVLPLRVGSYGGSSNFFGGVISGVHIYNRYLTRTEIRQHFRGSFPNETAGLEGLWNLDGNTNDTSGNVINGILNLGSGGNTTVANAWLSSKNAPGNVPIPLQTICMDGKDNNCNGFTDSLAGYAEAGCDNIFDSVTVSQVPAGDVYSTDAVTLNSSANDSLAITSHNIQWSVNGGPWNYTLLADCTKSPDEKTSTCVKNIGTFAAGTNIKYKAEALDASENLGTTAENEIIIRDACYGNADGSVCNAGAGVCCGGFCDSLHWRKALTISGSAGGALTDYQVKVNVVKESKMKADFSDVYFTDSDGVAMLSFWRESYNSTSSVFWVKTPSIPSAPGTKVIYMYYGSPIVNTASNGSATFDFFDDFESGNLTKWTVVSGSGYWGLVSDTFYSGNSSLRGGESSADKYIVANGLNMSNVAVDAMWRTSYAGSNMSQAIRSSSLLPINNYETNLEGSSGWNISKIINGTWSEVLANQSPPSANVWTKVTTAISGTKMRVFKNDIQILPSSGTTDVGTQLSTGSIGFRARTISAGNNWWIDDVRTRKYIDPEPTVAVGAETTTSLTEYLLDSECSQVACSAAIPTVWTWAFKNDGSSCSDGLNSSGCYVWPELGNGCETRNYACSNGKCTAPSVPADQFVDSCSGNIFNDYGCGAFCGVSASNDCSLTGSAAAAYNDPALSCNCKCGGFDKEEKFYQSLNFDGADDYVNTGSAPLLNDALPVTMEAWIYPTGWGEGNLGRIIDKAKKMFFLADDNAAYDNTLSFYQTFSINVGQWYTPNNSIILNQWQHVAVVYDSSSAANDPAIYINGVLQTLRERNIPSGIATSDASDSLMLGNKLALDRAFVGKIDEVYIYKRALSAQEILQHSIGEYPNEEGLVGLWHLDGNTNDTSGNSYNGVLNLGTSGNITLSEAWKSARTGADNIPLPGRVCTDLKNNDCDPLDKIDAAELACDGQAPIVTLEAKDNSGSLIANGAVLYDINIDGASEKLSFTSLASDNFSLLSHKLRWSTNNWGVTNEVDCTGGACGPYDILGTNFSALPKPITVKYYTIAVDNNNNSTCNPVGCQASANNFSIVAFNTPPVVTPVSIIQSGDYCKGGPQLTVKWNYSDNEGNPQKAYQVEIADNPSFAMPYTSSVFSSPSTTFTLSSGLNYNSTYYWRVKVWDDSTLSMVSAGSGGACGGWKCDLGQNTTTPLHEYPAVSYNWLPESPKVSEEVQFNNTSTPVTGVTWEWDLNSPSNKCGSPSYSVTAANRDNIVDWDTTYIYSEPTYFATGLKITDSDGYACEIQKCISIGKKPPRWKEIIPK